jgi:hypothetical protein
MFSFLQTVKNKVTTKLSSLMTNKEDNFVCIGFWHLEEKTEGGAVFYHYSLSKHYKYSATLTDGQYRYTDEIDALLLYVSKELAFEIYEGYFKQTSQLAEF